MRPAHIKEQRQKEVRQIWKRQRAIWKEIRELPYHKLDKPIRHGWYKEIVLTRNIDRYKNKSHIEEVFELIEKQYWGKSKADCEKKWDNQTSRYLIFRDFPTISKKQYNKLSNKAKALCTVFSYYDCRKIRKRFYVRIPKNAYQIRFSRAYITHVQEHHPELFSEDDLLEQQLIKRGYYEVNRNTYYYRDDWSVSKTKKQRIKTKQHLGKYKNASLGSIIDELWEVN